MRLGPLVICFGSAVVALTSSLTAFAADQNSAASVSSSSGPDQAIVLPGPDSSKPLRNRNAGVPLADKDVCYTIRSYKVKPTERIKDGESVAAGYSTCEIASSYRIRSADARGTGRK